MKKQVWICWGVAVLSVAFASGSRAAGRIVGIVPTDGATMMIKEFSVAAGTTISGVQLENNDAATSFPEISLVRGPLTSIAGGIPVATATQVRPGAGNVTLAWPSPVVVAEEGIYYVAVRFPAGGGKQSAGRGPALGASDVASPNGSYVAASATDPLIPSRMNLAVELVTSASGGASKTADVEPEAGSTLDVVREELQVRTASGRLPATIRFGLPGATEVILDVYDVSGRLVEEIVHGALPAGMHQKVWNNAGSAAGVYFVRLETSRRTLTEKLVIAH